MKEQKIKKILNNFSSEFETETIPKINISFLKDMASEYLLMRCHKPLSLNLIKEQENLKDKLINNFNEEQKELLEQLLNKSELLYEEEIEQAFIIGVVSLFEFFDEVSNVKESIKYLRSKVNE